MRACRDKKFYCNETSGSECVYISGGLVRTPLCTCSTVDDCVDKKYKDSICAEYHLKMPNNYKGKVCYLKTPVSGIA